MRRNYLPEVSALDLGPGLFTLNVEHDHWCPRINGSPECTCDPIIRLPKRVEL
jgi:hypothetical protein